MKHKTQKRPTINQAVIDAGGQRAVADECGVKQPTVFKWTISGLPRTEWTGETSYATQICKLANRNPHKTQHWDVEALKARDAHERTAEPEPIAS